MRGDIYYLDFPRECYQELIVYPLEKGFYPKDTRRHKEIRSICKRQMSRGRCNRID